MNIQQIVETAYARANGDWQSDGLIPVELLEKPFSDSGDSLRDFLLRETSFEDNGVGQDSTEHLDMALGRMEQVLAEVQGVVDALRQHSTQERK
jgi:hypothetical protein